MLYEASNIVGKATVALARWTFCDLCFTRSDEDLSHMLGWAMDSLDRYSNLGSKTESLASSNTWR